jgi:hypothetical protein
MGHLVDALNGKGGAGQTIALATHDLPGQFIATQPGA